MLIEFRVSNYRSFNEEVAFSMVAAPRLRKLKGNTHHTPEMKALKIPPLLKVAAIYGPNASGKSNLLLALDAVSDLIEGNFVTEQLKITPHKYDDVKLKEPSKFNLVFLARQENKLQTYSLEIWATSDRIIKETLWCDEIDGDNPLYARSYDDIKKEDRYVFSKHLEGSKALHQVWCKSTPPNSLFLTKAVNNSDGTLLQLKTPQNWLLWFLSINTPKDELKIRHGFLKTLMMRPEKLRQNDLASIAQFISDFDIPIQKIDVKKRNESYEITFTHLIAGKIYDFDISEESDGTKTLFFLALAFTYSKELAQTLVFDELDRSIHPLIIRKIVEQMSKNEIGTQLIFTTHDTHLMDSNVMRRDQFWLMERSRKGASTLTSIYEYKGREGEDIEKRYYEGRYRALPIVF
jgi:AAA15 family ATPase/GTPase